MPSFCAKIHTKHQSRYTGHHTLIMHSLTLPVNMRACSWVILRPDTLPGDHAFIHTSGQNLVMQITTGHMTGSHTKSHMTVWLEWLKVIWLSHDFVGIKRAVFAFTIQIGTNSDCNLFESLLEFKSLRFDFRSKMLCLDCERDWGIAQRNPNHRKIWSLLLWTWVLFNWVSPDQGFNPVKFDGLSGENSVTMGNKNKEFFSLPVLHIWHVWVDLWHAKR